MRSKAPFFAFSRLLRAKVGMGAFLCALILALPVWADSSEPARLAPQSLLLSATKAGDILFTAGERGHILRSADNGASWQQIITPTRAMLTAISFADAQHGWAVGQDATILATSDGGTTWAQQFHTSQLPDDDSARDAPLLAISCANITSCTAVGAYSLFLTTSDGGSHWQRTNVKESDSNLYAVHMFDAQHIVIAGEGGALLESTTGGAEWTALSMPYDGSFFGFHFLPNGSWLVYGLRGHILRSDDSGATWQDISSGVDTGLMGGDVLNDGRIVLVGAGGVVLISNDSAHSFTLARQSNRAALADVIDSADNKLILFGEKGVQAMEAEHAR